MKEVGKYVGTARTVDSVTDYVSTGLPIVGGLVQHRRAKDRTRARVHAAATRTRDEQPLESKRYTPADEPGGSGQQRLEPGPRNPAPRQVGEGTAWQGRSGNNYQEEGEPLDAAGNLVTDEEGLCQCGPCKKRRAESAASRDEAIEPATEPGMSLDSPKAVNEYNRRRFGRK